MSGYYLKAAQSELCCAMNWRSGPLQASEMIVDDLGWNVLPVDSPEDLRVSRQVLEDGISKVVVEDGIPGRTYMLSGRVGTNRGRVLDRSIVVRVAGGEAGA